MNDNKFENNNFNFENKSFFKKIKSKSLNNKKSLFKLLNQENNEENEIKDINETNKDNNPIIFEELEEDKYINLHKTYFNNKYFKNTYHIILNKINSNLCEIFTSSKKENHIVKNNKKIPKLKSN